MTASPTAKLPTTPRKRAAQPRLDKGKQCDDCRHPERQHPGLDEKQHDKGHQQHGYTDGRPQLCHPTGRQIAACGGFMGTTNAAARVAEQAAGDVGAVAFE